MNRLIILPGLVFFAACQSITEVEMSVESDAQQLTDESVDSVLEAQSKQQADFEILLSKAITERLIAPDDQETMALIHRFFPNTTRFEQQAFSLEPVAGRDSFWLLLYEFVSDQQDRNQIYLGSFRKTGNVVDLLEIQPISVDGYLSLNLLEGDILEIDYRDFHIRSDYPNLQSSTDPVHPQVRPVALQHYSAKATEREQAGTKYFRIQPDGSFEALATDHQQDIDRMFPQISSRILSTAELERLQPDEFELMRNELFASHGFVFEDELLTAFFEEKGWYHPDSTFRTTPLTDVERINLDRMIHLNWMSDLK